MTQERERSAGHLLVVLQLVGVVLGVVVPLPPVSAGEITQKC